ncbi:MAG: iron-sulfur protein [Pseudonocardiaceae bacterium]|nr:iron-sulfur protein [Pseudonocardiaceae bacterium]
MVDAAARTPSGVGLPPSLVRVRARQQRMTIHAAVPPVSGGQQDWTGCAQALADPAFFDRWRKRLAGWLHEQYGEAPERTTAAYVMAWYAQVPGYLGALLFHHERRVPSLRPADLAFRLSEGRPHPDGIALTAHEFACLPDDPAAGTPEATVLRSEQALAGVLRARYAAHLARFVAAFGPTVRFGRHTLWAAATDALDTALWQVGLAGGDEGAGVADAALVLAKKQAPFTSASTMRRVAEGEHERWSRRREGCCFHYLLERGKGECASCPRFLPKD